MRELVGKGSSHQLMSKRLRRAILSPRCCWIVVTLLICGFFLTHFVKKTSRKGPLPNALKMSPYWKRNYTNRYAPTDFNSGKGKLGTDFWVSPKVSFGCPAGLLDKTGGFKKGKWTCGLGNLGKLTQKKGYPCVVYSFGIGNDTRFERDVLLQTSCTVYAFDPNMSELSGPISKSPRMIFKKVGIDGDNGFSVDGYISWATGSTLSTLRTIMEANNHTWLDILKADVEGAEYESLERVLDDFEELPFGQLLVQVHVNWENYDWYGFVGLFQRLETKGLRLFHVEPKGWGNDTCCAEYSFINLHSLGLFFDDFSLNAIREKPHPYI